MYKFQDPIYKNVEFCILPEDKSRVRVYLFVCFVCFFPRGHLIDHVVLECRERAHSSGNEKF